MAEQPNEQITEQPEEQIAEQVSGQPEEQITEQVSEQSEEQIAEQVSEQSEEQIAEQVSEQSEEPVAEQEPEQPEEEAEFDTKPVRKRKAGYHLMLFLDGKDGMIRQMGISRGFVDSLIVIVLILISIPFVGWKLSRDKADELQARLNQSKEQYEELAAQKSELEIVNNELNNKVTILSDTVNAKVEKETALEKEVDMAHTPNGFPLSSSASMEMSEEDRNRVIFTAESGNILAAGAGVVSEITADDHYAKKVSIDHENGYVTVYYNNGSPMVKEGDQVLGNSILFIINEDNAKLAYEIYKDGNLIDPMSVINIDG